MLSKSTVLSLFVCALASAASNQDLAPQLSPPFAGQDTLRGTSQADAHILRLKIHQPDGTVTQAIDVLVQPDHSFLAGLQKPLEAGQIAIAIVLSDGVEARASAPVLVQAATPKPVAAANASFDITAPEKPSCAATPIRLTVTPTDGQTTLYAVGAASTDTLKCAVSVFINGDEAMLINSTGADSQSVETGSDAAFSIQLKDPLASGQCVVAMQYGKGHQPVAVTPADLACQTELGSPNPSAPYSVSPGVLVTSYLNLGRVRSYFAGGFVLTHDNNDFTNANTYLSFNLDKNWLWGGPVGQQYRRMMFNTFFETRLTSIPVSTGGSTTSRETASLIAGAYAPFVVTTWVDRRDPYALTLGPVAKVGFDTPVSAATADASGAAERCFYTNFGFGSRIGISKMSYSKDVAPELVSYLDVVTGRFSNFDGPAADDRGAIHRPWRIQMEGILKVPGYPLVMGFQANIRQNLGFGHAWQVAAKDDLRFFFGTRFDAGNAIARLTGQK